ncbi:prepilin-type N-terminal cleavage/methylation domain-containing protein [Candidatus Parcubacteria bacterium]|nr:prepilin-type N-terminal cleavage/methylation domain-containing protein [Candidatus Parcubacteria bacterium]
MLNKTLKSNAGVTLLEMMVAVAIFSVVMLSATKIFQIVIESQRSAIAAQNLQESMRYAFEVMAKEIRMAQKITSGSDCTGLYNIPSSNIIYYLPSSQELRFKNIYNECVKYYLNGTRLKIGRNPDVGSAVEGYITPDEIEVSNLEFIVIDDVGNEQSMVTIKMDIEAVGSQLHKQTMKIQTTISSRYYE